MNTARHASLVTMVMHVQEVSMIAKDVPVPQFPGETTAVTYRHVAWVSMANLSVTVVQLAKLATVVKCMNST